MTTPNLLPTPTSPADTRPRPLRRGAELIFGNKLAVVGAGVIIAMMLFCFVGPLLYHTDQVHTNLANALFPPGAGHPLGTDDVGYDELGRLMVGGRTSLEVGLAAALLATLVGTLYGAVSGYVGGKTDTAMMRLVDGFLAIPGLFLVLVLATIFQPTKTTLIVIIAFFSWLGAARLIRGEALSMRTREFILSVRLMGGGDRRAIIHHVLVNTIGTIVVFATFATADAILTLAALGYLGLGVQPPATDWGSMLSNGVQFVNNGNWWLIYPPGVAVILIVVALNFIGDALRDAMEVRLQRP